MKPRAKILFIASSWNQDSFYRAQCFSQLLHEVDVLDMHPEHMGHRWTSPLWRTMNWLNRKLDRVYDHADINIQIINTVENKSYDLVWIEKGLSVMSETIQKIKMLSKSTKVVGYSADDLLNLVNTTKAFRASLGLYDHFFTTKSYNVEELKELGCRSVSFIGNAYEPSIHYPIKDQLTLTDVKYKAAVGFVGAYESFRAYSISHLSRNIEQSIKVFGPRWRRARLKDNPKLLVKDTYLEGLEYTKAICSADINLGFLHKGNRDLQTTRSVEIPACGGFLLAERTEEHRTLFEEDKEAVYFDSDHELIEKVSYYLQNESERKAIAQRGYQRCIQSGYSNLERVREMMEYLRAI